MSTPTPPPGSPDDSRLEPNDEQWPGIRGLDAITAGSSGEEGEEGWASSSLPTVDTDIPFMQRWARLGAMQGDRGGHAPRPRRSGSRRLTVPVPRRRTVSTWLILGLLLLVGAITLQASGGITVVGADGTQLFSINPNGVTGPHSAGARGQFAADTPTATPLPPAPTDTPAPPAPTATPAVPAVQLAFDCASTQHDPPPADQTLFGVTVCMHTDPPHPNDTVNFTVSDCNGVVFSAGTVLDATGHQTFHQVFHSSCVVPFPVRVSATALTLGGSSDTLPLTGTVTLMMSS
jgi:hypothetical protein